MGDQFHQRKIESEMDRFEHEISSLGPTTMSRSFIPAQLRRPMQQGHSNPLPPGTSAPNAPPPPPPSLARPSPVFIR